MVRKQNQRMAKQKQVKSFGAGIGGWGGVGCGKMGFHQIPEQTFEIIIMLLCHRSLKIVHHYVFEKV